MDNKIPFRPVKGLEKTILNSKPEAGKLYFATDTKKIYLADNENFLPMGGNSGVYYGNMTLNYEPDSSEKEFLFSLEDIEGTQIPNKDDLILNYPDGCFYRVKDNNQSTETGERAIKAEKLTVAGSGGGGGGGGSSNAKLLLKHNGDSELYFTTDVKEAIISFNASNRPVVEDNFIVNIKYYLGSNPASRKLLTEDFKEYPMGDITFNLLPYFSQLSKSGSNTIAISVVDAYGEKETIEYKVSVIELSLSSQIKDNILLTDNGIYNYYCIPNGGSELENRKVLFEFYDQDGNHLTELDQSQKVSFSGSEVTTSLKFNNTGVYTMKVTYVGNIKNSERPPESSNVLTYKIVNYREDPILTGYFPDVYIEQYDTIDIDYLLASTENATKKVNVTLIKNNEEVVQEIDYNTIQKWSIYFDTAGVYNLQIKYSANQIINFENIIVNEYTGEMPIIDPTQTDLYLSAVNRSNTELHKNTWTYKDAYCTFENFIWGNINGWMKDDDKIDMLHLSSGAKLTLENYFPYSADKNIMTNNSQGQTIELDFKISGTTDFSKPLIKCLSYDNKGGIQVGFNITGQESTMNTAQIKATGAEIEEGDEEWQQIYNTAVQGLTTKFVEDERIHLTWVIERNNNDYPLIITYLNGVLSGITKYDTKDSMEENVDFPAKLIIDSTYGDIDIYNIRVYKRPLSSKDVLDNYIATLPTAEARVKKYHDNNDFLEDGRISVEAIENSDYILSVPYIKIIGGRALTKDDKGYKLNLSNSSVQLPVTKKDYRLIEKYSFIDQSGKHQVQNIEYLFNKEGYLEKGVVMYGQGTSSMEYPVKNLRFKSVGKNENGEKIKFKVNENDCPVNLVCLKADYMESSGSHNTGTGNLIYNLTKQSNNDFQYESPAQKEYKNKEDYDIVTAIRGYPIALFYKGSENEKYEYVGKYNFNLDKATQEPFGFYSTPEKMPENGELPADNFGWAKADETYTDKDENDEYKFAENGYVKTIHCYEFLNNSSALANFLGDPKEFDEFGNVIERESFETTFFKDAKDDKGRTIPNWALSFESRYPEAEEDDFSDIDIASWYRVTSWVNSCNPAFATNELLGKEEYGYTVDSSDYRLAKFKAEFNEYFDMTFSAVYYVLTHLLLMIDSRAKNMMMATWNNKIWFPIFYDMDTMLGLNNYGYNKFNYDVEDKDRDIYNGDESVFWNNFKECFSVEIANMYNILRSRGVDYKNLMDIYNLSQADALNEMAFNEDAKYKYIRPFTEPYEAVIDGKETIVPAGSKDYLYASQGRRSMHREWWLKNRLNYLDGKYLSDDYKENYFEMRLYTPTAGGNYYSVPDLTLEEFNSGEYFIRKSLGNNKYEYEIATEYDSNTTYYKKANTDKITASLKEVKANNDFYLTPLYNQYLSVAYGKGSNGVTTSPKYTRANEVCKITATGTYNDTETYIYGGSLLKDLGDLSHQYLGKFIFPKGSTKLETLILGNKNNAYYNPNFSSLEINNSAPYLKKLDVTNCIGLGRKGLNLSKCSKLQELYATGSGITAVSLPEHGVIEELRLPDTLTTLTLIDQPYLTDEKFTIGSYNSSSNSYEANNFSVLDIIDIENVPNLNSYEIVKGGTALQKYKLINVNWKINDSKDLNENGYIKVLERMLGNESNEVNKIRPMTSTAECLTGTLTINCEVDDAYIIYNRYWKYFPELNIKFTNAKKDIYDVNIYDGNGNIYWTKKISEGENIDEEFLSDGPSGTFEFPTMLSTAQYSYIFKDKWNIKYADGVEDELLSAQPYLNNITKAVEIRPVFESIINKYMINIYIDDKKILSKKYDYGTKLSEIVELIGVPYKDENNLLLTEAYKFRGYSITKQYADAGLIINDISQIAVTKKTDYYVSFEKISVYDNDNILDEKYFRVGQDQFGEAGYFLAFEGLADNYILLDKLDKEEFDNNASNLYYVLKRNNNSVTYELANIVYNEDETYYYKQLSPLRGKITLPVIYNGKSFDGITQKVMGQDFSADLKNITHIFWDNKNVNKIRKFGSHAFDQAQQLIHMEMPEISNGETIKINDYAFNGTQHLFGSNIDIASKLAEEFFKNISYIGPYAFMNCRVREKGATFILPETVYYVGTEAFTHIYGGVSAFQFGAKNKPTLLSREDSGINIFNGTQANIIIYYDPSTSTDNDWLEYARTHFALDSAYNVVPTNAYSDGG